MEAICKADYDNRVKAKKDFDKEAKQNTSAKATQIGIHDIFGVDQEKMMHVFIDIEPDKIPDGIHDITVYSHQCRFYKWKAQGYHRGLVVLADDMWGCAAAQVYMKSKTWSWMLNDEDKAKLPSQTNDRAEKDSVIGDGCPTTGTDSTRD
jgi:hypothetical protein